MTTFYYGIGFFVIPGVVFLGLYDKDYDEEAHHALLRERYKKEVKMSRGERRVRTRQFEQHPNSLLLPLLPACLSYLQRGMPHSSRRARHQCKASWETKG